MHATLALSLAARAIAPAAAVEWVDVGADEQTRHYLDGATLARNGDVVRIDKRAVFTAPLSDGHELLPMTASESRGVVEVDCVLRVHRVVEIELFDAQGRSISRSGPMRRIWEDVTPGTPGARTMEVACTRTAAGR
ncbi:MAG: hypothetical protein MUF30_06400 [Burkholderiales bacterium]|nr:hypothetical protein [Burkholderiales bacterium]